MNELITEVFVEQPLASQGSANKDKSTQRKKLNMRKNCRSKLQRSFN